MRKRAAVLSEEREAKKRERLVSPAELESFP